MRFKPLPPIFDGQQMWGAVSGLYTFIVVADDGKFTASAKLNGMGQRIDIGDVFNTRDDAAAACEEFAKGKAQ